LSSMDAVVSSGVSRSGNTLPIFTVSEGESGAAAGGVQQAGVAPYVAPS
jgi:hypothetical protein